MNDPTENGHAARAAQLETALRSCIDMLQESMSNADSDLADAIDAVLIEAQNALSGVRRNHGQLDITAMEQAEYDELRCKCKTGRGTIADLARYAELGALLHSEVLSSTSREALLTIANSWLRSALESVRPWFDYTSDQHTIPKARQVAERIQLLLKESVTLSAMEVESVAIATTGHATRKESKILDANGYSRGEYGWLICISPSRDPVIPEIGRLSAGLAGAIRLAQKRGCAYLLLDRDADPMEGVKTYNW